MPKDKLTKKEAQKLLDNFTKIQNIRQESLRILLDIDEKIGKKKIEKFKNELEVITE